MPRTSRLWLVLLVAVAACNSGAVEAPSDDPPPPGTQQHNNNDDDDGGQSYSPFDLPVGDTSTVPGPSRVYDLLQVKDCGSARDSLNADQNDPLPAIKPDQARLLRVGIALCSADYATALKLFPGVIQPPTGYMCELYRAAAHVLEHKPRSAYGTCPPNPPEDPDPVESETVPAETETPAPETTAPEPVETPEVPVETSAG
ncbi:hypothetical protein ABGB12_11495 [Actinocorallia sp. B10E7]|uniref:hypothetical protein n=1 Tax=Actinocorallia sp. B10E7 TaxID=3153558 RepID=UPI00325EC4DA